MALSLALKISVECITPPCFSFLLTIVDIRSGLKQEKNQVSLRFYEELRWSRESVDFCVLVAGYLIYQDAKPLNFH